MRTREEQIEALRDLIDMQNECPDETDSINQARDHILEAERRAEQRVRAEIGRDSERLDWLGCNLVSITTNGTLSKRRVLSVQSSGKMCSLVAVETKEIET